MLSNNILSNLAAWKFAVLRVYIVHILCISRVKDVPSLAQQSNNGNNAILNTQLLILYLYIVQYSVAFSSYKIESHKKPHSQRIVFENMLIKFGLTEK